jgi:hydroxylamine reductase
MFCYQCEQSAKGGCQVAGVCGKSPEVAELQDKLLAKLKAIAAKAVQDKVQDETLDLFLVEGLFTTVTNVNFDPARIEQLLQKADRFPHVTIGQEKIGVKGNYNVNEDIRSLRELLTYGLKGLAAYADHAYILGKKDATIFSFIREALAALLDDTKTVADYLALNLKCGEVNIRTMEILSLGHTDKYGHPVPTKVFLGVKKGPAILISGHDLVDLEALLKQTEGTGINVYTHGEMIPAHGYPGLKKYRHLVGNYGGAWQDQQKEFAEFPGAILMTTNCIQKPKESYIKNIFTAGLVAFPGVAHINDRTYAPVIAKAKELGGFPADVPGKDILVGFGHNAVLGVADKVIDAVKAGKIKHFYLIGGCDGAKSGRNYYTEFAEKAPKDTVILTLACGKYRFNKLDFGDIGGIPRLLDVGQCNDAYSAIQIAVALAKAFNVGVNELPLSFILSWYEQKAVVILLSLLFLGIKNIKLGPTLPEFISPNILKFLVENFNIGPTGNVDKDLAETLK